ncbi:MAG: cytochrome c biogenesis protein CcsA [Planctomycetaceae bacterium]
MAHGNLPQPDPTAGDASHSPVNEAGDLLFKTLQGLASLKLTVGLFAFSIALILFGTLAQVNLDIWAVLGQYFRVWVAKVELQIFFPGSFFEGRPPTVAGWFPFPGGKTIGTLLFLNLFAAHAVRFKIQARGARLWAGLGTIVLGVVATWLVIISGSNKDGFQTEVSGEFWNVLWTMLKYGLGVAWVAMASSLLKIDSSRKLERWGVIGLTLLLGAALVYLFYRGDDAKLDDSSMRILWQLLKGAFAGLVLLAGCILVFRKRGGIVLLHGGVGLMMFSELLVAMKNHEAQMQIVEGQTVNFVQDSREPELAIIDHSPEKHDKVVVISAKRLVRAFEAKDEDEQQAVIDYEPLPFRLEVVRYMKNSSYRRGRDPESPVTRGRGLTETVEQIAPGSGTDSGSSFDMASAYVDVIDRKTSKSVGVYLFTQHRPGEQAVTAGGKTFGVSLRSKRIYKPYSMHLIDARGDTYLGTDTARNYSSELELVDESRGVQRTVKIWMNNPLRYAGETFYQSSYGRYPGTNKEFTVLQVVTNTGWMIPYVACMIVATGLLAHFWIVLLRFLNRRAAGAQTPGRTVETPALNSSLPSWLQPNGQAAVWFPAAICALVAFWLAGKLMTATRNSAADEAMNIRAFGDLPVVYQGRVKPFDSLSRNSLRVISAQQTFRDQNNTRQPAIRWLLDTITKPETADKYRVYKVVNLDVLSTLGQGRRKGFRYSFNELTSRRPELDTQVRRARAEDRKRRTVFQRKILELHSHMSAGGAVRQAHRIPPADVGNSHVGLLESIVLYRHRMSQVPLACPMPGSKDRWQALTVPATRLWVRRFAKARKLKSLDAVFIALIRHAEDPEVRPRIDEQLFRQKLGEMKLVARQRGMAVSDEDIERVAREYLRQLRGPRYRMDVARLVRTRLTQTMNGESLTDPDPPQVVMLVDILAAYRDGDAKTFDEKVAGYKKWLAENAPEGEKPSDQYHPAKLQFESMFNRFEPYFKAWMIYLAAFLLAAFAWLGWSKPLNRASFGLVGIAFVIHTVSLIARMYISGRWGVMVTNLYSSALFIGWGCCLLGMILESVYGIGIGNAVASVSGFGTLWIAQYLSFDGDTIAVMQAVLDTNFWLATHVTTITLGYATTYVAGLLGVAYILLGVATPALTPSIGRSVNRMIYGTLCFAIFFSFVGTVLGGLWADDSWGRFWGWDPKENGALIIVLWNALVLHARWGGLVKDRGMALLAVGGNIVTSWSWFGVNLLGVGLHAYGFKEGVGLALILFAASQLAFIGVGFAPKEMWWSFRRNAAKG